METNDLEKSFKNFEKDSLLLDILIDCEEYDEFDNRLKKIKGIKGNISIGLVEEHFNEEIIRGKIKEIDPIVPSNYQDFDNYFKIVLSSKYVRRLLKEKEREIELKLSKDIFKNLTESLLRKIPPKSDKQSKEKNRQNQLRIIFLNEISAASEGNLAIGYADIALDELRDLNEDWLSKKNADKPLRHPYELYALYNKGLSFLHGPPGNPEKAIKIFHQILQSFETDNGGEESFEIFIKENNYKYYKNFFNIFYWLIYMPTKYLIAEAYSDLSYSYDVEATLKTVFDKIKNDILLENKKLTKRIRTEFESKFTTQLIFSRIDSQSFSDDLSQNQVEAYGWLECFGKIAEVNENFDSFKSGCARNSGFLEKHQIIKNQLHSAEALFYLEYAKKGKKENNDHILKSINRCTEHLDDIGPDWSDFAVTFLEGVLFRLENYKGKKPWPESLKVNNEKSDEIKEKNERIFKFYESIFNKICDRFWLNRKKDLVEKFMGCQERLLNQYEKYVKKEEKGDFDKYLLYQIRFCANIFKEEGEQIFQKTWPDCVKEKLVKTLNMALKNIGYETILAWWNNAKANSLKEIDRKQDFEKIVEDMQNILCNKTYSLPENDALSPIAKFIEDKMNSDFYTKKLRLNTEEFNDHLIYKSCRPSLKNSYGLTVLRRWQSFTPALSMGSEVGHKGGGYFVYKTGEKGEIDEGLVIDPGFDFLENFFDEGFSIKDIDAILMTHSHRDHSSDFISILTLVHEMNKRGKRVFKDKWQEKQDKKLVLFMTEGCHQNFAEQINRNRETFHDIIRVKQRIKYGGRNSFLDHFHLEVQKANHNDLTDHDSVGYIIKDNSSPQRDLIGFTGDTQWFNGIEDRYKDCPIICMNIGGVVDIFKEGNIMLSDLTKKTDPYFNNIRKILLTENHLYLPGFYLMAKGLCKSKQKLLIISELCEELKGGLRTDLSKKIGEGIDGKIPVLPEDVGLTVRLDKKKAGHVLCKVCQLFHPPKEIVPVETDKDNAIVYLCKDHYRQMREGYSIPKINELELELNELRKPIEQENRP